MSNTTIWDSQLYTNKHSFVYKYGEDLLRLLDPKDNERILDIGCGTGQLTAEIKKSAKEVIGIDKSPEMIAQAKHEFKNIDFQVRDATNFIFTKRFDSIFSNATIHWMLDYKSVIRCMFDNLNPKGKIVVEFGGKGNVQTIVNQLRSSLQKRGYKKQSTLQLWYFPSIAEYTTELEAVGFRVVLAEHYDRPTELADEKTGIKDWLSMFGKSFFVDVSLEHIEEIKDEIQEKIKSQCFINGKWFADYKRIRIIAVKEKISQ